jgi:hypothetical protein
LVKVDHEEASINSLHGKFRPESDS